METSFNQFCEKKRKIKIDITFSGEEEKQLGKVTRRRREVP